MKTSLRISPLTLPGLILLAVLVTACSGILTSEQPAKQYYTLTPFTVAANTSGEEPGPALSITVSAVPGLDTDRILALGPDARLHRFANARWPDNLPEVVSSVMKRSLASTGRFSMVDEIGRATAGGWLLKLEIQQFYGIQDTAGISTSVLVEMAGSLECDGRTRQLELSDSRPVAGERLSTVVAAHQAGLNGVTRQLLDQVREFCTPT